MQKKFVFFFSALLVMAFLIGCSPAAESVTTGLIDGLGREISLENPAVRIVSLSPSNTEILYTVGAGDQVIGRDSFSDYPEKASSLVDIGGGYSEYNLEQIVALEPDLVLAAEINTAELVQSIEDLGIPVFYISNPLTFEDLYKNIENVGLLTGQTDNAQIAIDGIRTRVDVVVAAIAETDTTPVVFYELDATDPTKPYTPGVDTYYSTFITMAGGKNVGDVLASSWAQISLEELIIQDPDVILLGDSLWGITPESVGEREGWNSLTAVQEGNVLPFDDNLLARPGPRLVDGLEALAQVLHPEVFD
jgi:iron complex transport system substrate-binding protein